MRDLEAGTSAGIGALLARRKISSRKEKLGRPLHEVRAEDRDPNPCGGAGPKRANERKSVQSELSTHEKEKSHGKLNTTCARTRLKPEDRRILRCDSSKIKY